MYLIYSTRQEQRINNATRYYRTLTKRQESTSQRQRSNEHDNWCNYVQNQHLKHINSVSQLQKKMTTTYSRTTTKQGQRREHQHQEVTWRRRTH
eukprot:5434564-Amphidinium_carterae.1